MEHDLRLSAAARTIYDACDAASEDQWAEMYG